MANYRELQELQRQYARQGMTHQPQQGLGPMGSGMLSALSALQQASQQAARNKFINPMITGQAPQLDPGAAADFTPVVGGVKGAIEEAQAGNYGMAALNSATVPLDLIPGAGVGAKAALPFIGDALFGLKTSGMRFDPRYDTRVLEQQRLDDLNVRMSGDRPEAPSVSIVDLEGRPFITSMSDRTRADGSIIGINDIDLNNPVETFGGQDYMFNNPGQVWASAQMPVRQIQEMASLLRKETGQNPVYLPWRMAPSGGDFAHMTGETMLAYAATKMNKKNRAKLNTRAKRLIPGWPGIDNPAAVDAFRNAPDKARKEFKKVLDRDFRNAGGLGLGEARLAVTDPTQLTARDGGLQNIGEVFADQPMVMDTRHPSYPRGVPGQGIGRLAEDVGVYQLLPEHARRMGVTDPLNPNQGLVDPEKGPLRSLQMKPYGGVITEEILRSLGL